VDIYPEFQNRNVEDIPVDEYRSAMDGAFKYVFLHVLEFLIIFEMPF